MLTSRAGRDDTDDFFAIFTTLPIDVNDEQQSPGPSLNARGADSLPALLSCFAIDAIRAHQAALVFKYKGGQFE
jgi:hypothetical protein